ncbi:MAG: hypothetical protein M5U34_32185 [Chloroflexi bacterium]|nr:hypothetical protein [Chloroflexota bacterium]
MRQIERAKLAFLQAVQTGRGDRLNMDLDVLSRAEIYTGVQALEFGLIDGLAANEVVIDRAAELAGLSNYEVVELFLLTFDEELGFPLQSVPAGSDRRRPAVGASV